MTIIDAHYHLVPNEGEINLHLGYDYTGDDTRAISSDAEATIKSMDKNGIDLTVLCGSAQPTNAHEEYVRMNNNFVAKAVHKYPKRFVGFCVTSPFLKDRGAKEITRSVNELGFKGIKLHGDYCGWASLDEMRVIFETASDLELPIVLHSADPPFFPDRIGVYARHFPKVKFIALHFGGGTGWKWRTCMENATDFKNYFIELSQMYPHYDAIRKTIKEAGASQLIYGSDGPYFDFNIPFYRNLLERADATESEIEAVLGGNIAKILGLDI